MVQAFQHGWHGWHDLAAITLALGYIAGFLTALEFALARLLFLAAF